MENQLYLLGLHYFDIAKYSLINKNKEYNIYTTQFRYKKTHEWIEGPKITIKKNRKLNLIEIAKNMENFIKGNVEFGLIKKLENY